MSQSVHIQLARCLHWLPSTFGIMTNRPKVDCASRILQASQPSRVLCGESSWIAVKHKRRRRNLLVCFSLFRLHCHRQTDGNLSARREEGGRRAGEPGGVGGWGRVSWCKPIGSVDFHLEYMSAHCVHVSIPSKCGAGRVIVCVRSNIPASSAKQSRVSHASSPAAARPTVSVCISSS